MMLRALGFALLFASPALGDTAEVVKDHIRAGFQTFADQTRALSEVDSCDEALLRPAFQDSFDAWMAVAHLHLGPAEQGGRALAIFFWPDPKGQGWKAQQKLLAADPARLDPTFIAAQSVAARGLAGLERLLYPAPPLAQDPCPLIHATADDLARTAQELAAEWGPFGALMLTPGAPGNTRFLDDSEVRQALLTQLATGIEVNADSRLGRPLGTFEKPRPDLAEARASGRSLRNVVLSVQALQDLTRRLSPDSVKTQAGFDRVLHLARTLDDPVFAGVADPQRRLKVEILQSTLRGLRDTAIAELGADLGVGIGFNALDGD
ncbi:MAG: imelysin family protein [Cypionkella sp.]|jgi:hypothetical protein|nr:imelysin family protein [Cypionkella sp.]